MVKRLKRKVRKLRRSVSGTVVVRVLTRAGWTKHSQVGSHVKMTRGGSILRTVEMTVDELRRLI